MTGDALRLDMTHPNLSVAIASIVTGIISLPIGVFIYAVIF